MEPTGFQKPPRVLEHQSMFQERAIPFGHLENNGSKNIPEAAVLQNLKGIKKIDQKLITFGIGQQKSPWSGFGVDPNESSQN